MSMGRPDRGSGSDRRPARPRLTLCHERPEEAATLRPAHRLGLSATDTTSCRNTRGDCNHAIFTISPRSPLHKGYVLFFPLSSLPSKIIRMTGRMATIITGETASWAAFGSRRLPSSFGKDSQGTDALSAGSNVLFPSLAYRFRALAGRIRGRVGLEQESIIPVAAS